MIETPDIDLPVARVAVDVWLPHLDRFFDYSVPAADAETAQPGARVRVRFSGQLLDGFIVERRAHSDAIRLSPLSRVVSPEPVFTPAQVALVRAVADHYAGTFADVMRVAVPPRHAATEKATPRSWPEPNLDAVTPGALAAMPAGPGFLSALERGDAPRAFWQVPISQGRDGVAQGWLSGVLDAVTATVRGGRGVIVLVPDVRDVARVKAFLGERFGEKSLAELHAGLGPAARYRNYLAVLRGMAKVVIGTRSASFAPMPNLGLVVMYDDGDDLYEEVRAPYYHARTVAALRASEPGVGLLFASHARSCEVQLWIDRGWLTPIALDGASQRRIGPVVRVSADSDHALERDRLAARVRMPKLAFDTIRAGLASGPVLVQVPRAGYRLALRCASCATPVRCPHCTGPLTESDREGVLRCGWCDRVTVGYTCPTCGGGRYRAPVVGAHRTADELGRAFPGTRVFDSSSDKVIDAVPDEPALVIATPGAEPTCAGGYSAAVLLDATQLLARLDLRASEEAFRRWANAAAMVRPAAEGGTVCVVGPATDRAVAALVRHDPGGFASRELADRDAAGFPPAWRFAMVEGEPAAVDSLIRYARLPEQVQVLGPVALPPDQSGVDLVRVSLRASGEAGRLIAPGLKAAAAIRSAKKEDGAVRIRIDPAALG